MRDRGGWSVFNALSVWLLVFHLCGVFLLCNIVQCDLQFSLCVCLVIVCVSWVIERRSLIEKSLCLAEEHGKILLNYNAVHLLIKREKERRNFVKSSPLWRHDTGTNRRG